ncbi:hypothetical protein RCC89_02975 [Cytophagaceae bacterium ABcell3]|nr:hypothetical protein RCC89_02975 [Cytophagaceae bacterium ABcell3]
MKREIINGKTSIQGFHTQENRPYALTAPVKCVDSKAWLGSGYYFWTDETFARYWGIDYKMKTGSYDIYTGYIEENNLLNTTFCEEDYFFLKNNIEKAIKRIKKIPKEVNLKQVHRFLQKEVWGKLGIKGIIYDDLPHNSYKKNRTYSLLDPLYYNKRIQIVVFTLDCVNNFEEYLIEQTS